MGPPVPHSVPKVWRAPGQPVRRSCQCAAQPPLDTAQPWPPTARPGPRNRCRRPRDLDYPTTLGDRAARSAGPLGECTAHVARPPSDTARHGPSDNLWDCVTRAT